MMNKITFVIADENNHPHTFKVIHVFKLQIKKSITVKEPPFSSGGVMIGLKIMENDIGRQYVSNYCPKSKKLNPWPPKPLNIDIGQSFPTSGSIES